MRDENLIVYVFVFTDEDGNKVEKDVWAAYETEACRKADEIAFENDYVSYEIVE